MNFDTTAIHNNSGGSQWANASCVPIFQTSSFHYDTAQELADVFEGKSPGYIYTRISNPTNIAFEMRLNALEDGIGAIATSSGMAAISSVVLGLLRSGDEIVATNGIFGGSVSLLKNILSKFGVTTKFIDPLDITAFKQTIGEKTRLVFTESICNPTLAVPDITEISKITRSANIPLIVDNTIATPYVFLPGKFGADIVIHSTSKFINGHGNAIGGAIIDTGNYNWKAGKFDDIKELARKAGNFAFLSHLRNLVHRDIGGCASPFNSFLMIQGLETIGLRMEKHCRNAMEIARFLEAKGVGQVNYPGLESSSSFQTAKKLFVDKFASVLTFGLGSKERAFKFIDSLKTAKNLANLGEVKTVVIHPASTIFREFSAEDLRLLGIEEDTVRISVGIEDIEDIKNDFNNAIENTLRR